MDIATGYFAKASQYADAGYALVSIAKVVPWFLSKDLKLHSLPELAPTEEILALKDNPKEYESRYNEKILANINPWMIYQKLYDISLSARTDKVVLLCYEAPGKFCHRHIVAKWMGKYVGRTLVECQIRQDDTRSLFDSDV